MKFFSRKAVSLIAVSLLAAGSLTACNRDGGGDSVTLALSTQTNPFFVQVRDGAQEKADELGITLNIQDASDDSAKQSDQLNNASTNGSSVVIVNPVDSDAVGTAVSALNKANIPVVAVDRAVNNAEVSSFIASDNVAGGKLAADALAQAIGKKGKVLVLEGVPGASSTNERGKGFMDQIATYSDIEVVASQTANFDRTEGLDVATNLLQANPDVVGIFAHNDEMALGALEALGDRAGKDVFVVGFDGTDDGIKAIAGGKMIASVAQQPELLGSTAVDIAVKLLKGESVQQTIPVDVVIIDGSNVADFQK